MEFLKKNYEKVILSIVLLGLAVATVLLLLKVNAEKQRLEEIKQYDFTTEQNPLVPLDTSTNEFYLRRLARPLEIELTGGNNLFNPVQWKRLPDGSLIKMATGRELMAALRVLSIKPLYLIVSYEGQRETAGLVQHLFSIERQAARDAANRRRITRGATSVGTKNDVFLLKEIRTPEDPREFLLEMVDDKREIVLSRGQPYEGVAGYSADLRYEPERKAFPNQRVDDKLFFAGESHKIVAISASSVTVEAPNRKRETVVYQDAVSQASTP